MQAEEHFYKDDPSAGPADARTVLDGVEYYFVGNGHIQAAVQVCASGAGTALGVAVNDPDRLGPKRDALTFDAATSLEGTMLTVKTAEGTFTPAAGKVDAGWTVHSGIPAVRATWNAGSLIVEEMFYCPDCATPRLVREMSLSRRVESAGRTESSPSKEVILQTGAGPARCECSVDLKESIVGARAFIEYSIEGNRSGRAAEWKWRDAPEIAADAQSYWNRLASTTTSTPKLDHLFNAARGQLPAAVSARGTMDGSIWQYNREWVRDQAKVIEALCALGDVDKAHTMLERLLTEFVSRDGDTIDSSKRRDPADVELDQNGQLLLALKAYVDWTGDLKIVSTHWDTIKAVADFPLEPVFVHAESGLLHNCREFWERHAIHGIEDGLELMYQYYVSAGLSAVAALARLADRKKEATRWQEAADRIKRALLHHETHSLVDEGRFIKRRHLSGAVQEEISLSRGADLPEGTPLSALGNHLLDPDASSVLPIATEFIDPESDLAKRTLEKVETLWNLQWEGGGYGRYHTSSEPDSPGPWPFASLFVARALVEAGDDAKVWRIVDWLNAAPGGRAGTWFEYYGKRISPPYPQVGITPWTWAEIVCLVVRHIFGVRPGSGGLFVRPRLLSGMDRATITLPVRGVSMTYTIRRVRDNEETGFAIDGEFIAGQGTGLQILIPRNDFKVEAIVGS